MSRLALRCLALTIALLIWWFVNGEKNITVKTILVPLDFKDKPSTKVIVSDLNRQIKVTLRGPGFLINKVENSQPLFKIVIPPTVDRKYTATFSKYDLGITPPVEVMEIEPPSVDVLLENSSTKEVEVVVPRIGSPNEGVKIESVQPIPDKVTIVGVESDLQNLKKVETEPVDVREFGLDNANEPVTKKMRIKVPGKFSSVPSGDQVDVQVQISAIEIQKVFSSVPIEIRSISNELFVVSPAKIIVEVAGQKKLIESLRKDQIFPFVRFYPGLAPDETVKVQVEAPKGVSVTKMSPPEVAVIKKKAEESKDKQGKKKK